MRELTVEEVMGVSGGTNQAAACSAATAGSTAFFVGMEFGPVDWFGFGIASLGMAFSCQPPK